MLVTIGKTPAFCMDTWPHVDLHMRAAERISLPHFTLPFTCHPAGTQDGELITCVYVYCIVLIIICINMLILTIVI